MTRREELLKLAERCERATGADWEIDLSIFRALNPDFAGPEWQPYANGLRHVNDGSDMRCLPPPEHTPPRWTASIDAALTLVPEGWHGAEVTLTASGIGLARTWDRLGTPLVSKAKTPALALCAASLKALAEQEAGE